MFIKILIISLMISGCITTRDPVQVKEIKVTCVGQVREWRGGHIVGYRTLWQDTDGNKYESVGGYHLPGEVRMVFVWR
jgi:hypothetical protein